MFWELWVSQRYLKARQRQRFISLTAFISMMGIAVGVAVLIVVISVMSGFDRYLEEKMVGTNAHLVVIDASQTDNSQEMAKKLIGLEEILAISPFIAGQAAIRENKQFIGVEFRGIEPESQQKITNIKEYLVDGSLDLQGDEIIIGEDLVDRLYAGVGDKVSIISPTSLKPKDFIIKGVFNSGMYLYDSNLVLTSLPAAEDFFKGQNMTRGLGVRISSANKSEQIKQLIYKRLGNDYLYSVRSWQDMNRNFLSALRIEKIVMFIVVTMTTVVAAFGIVGSLIMSIMSKVKDIGILRSIGAKAQSILMIFLLNGVGIGLMGIILGLIAGVALALSLNNIIDFISGVIGTRLIPKDVYYFDRLPTNFNLGDTSYIVISAFVIVLLASLYPAYQASRVNLSEALRHE